MAFTTNNPVERDGKLFDKLGVALITNPQFNAKNVGAQIVLHLYPYRIAEDGSIERPMIEVEGDEGPIIVIDSSTERGLVFGDAYATAAQDADVAKCLGGISALLQELIAKKNL